jgi:hypothetical protein
MAQRAAVSSGNALNVHVGLCDNPTDLSKERNARMSELVNLQQLDKTKLSVVGLKASSDDREYWAAKTPAERWAAMEWMRAVNYGYNPATDRLQRILAVAPLRAD